MWAGYMDEASMKLLQERGLFYTASHLEVLLSNPQNYWADWCLHHTGKTLPYSYTLHPDELEAYWRESIQKHAANRNVWPVGLRGNMDCAFWESDPGAPDGTPERAAVVTRAIRRQLELLHEELPGREIVATLTMRDEVLDLYLSGHLEIPDQVILIWDDQARRSLVRRLPDPENPAEARLQHGVYYHLNYCQNPRMQYVPPEWISGQFDRIVQSGATSYALFNVGNLRELALLAGFAMRLVWIPEEGTRGKACAESLFARVLGQSYPGVSGKALCRLYLDFIRTEFKYRVSQVADCIGPLVTGRELYAIWNPVSLLDLLREGADEERLVHFAASIDFSNLPDRCFAFSPERLRTHLPIWDRLHKRAVGMDSRIPENVRTFFRWNLLLQIQTARCFNRWGYEVLAGMKRVRRREFAAAASAFENAAGALDTLEEDRRRYTTGKWKNWFRGEYHNVFSKSLWTLKPRWHAADCHEIAKRLRDRIGPG
jgi:hypothetical protein